MSTVKIPATQFGQFLEAATKWLSKTSDYKTSGLDVSFEVKEGIVKMSTGGDSSFFEVSFPAEPSPEGESPATFEQVYLDLTYLSKIPLQPGALITLSKGKAKSGEEAAVADKRVAIRHQGMNYRVPMKVGDVWKKNSHDFNTHEITSYVQVEGREVFDSIYRESVLPASFGIKIQNLLCFHQKPGKEGVFVYTEDDMGAFCHQFTKGGITFSEGCSRVLVLYEFFTPIVKILDIQSMRVYSSDRYALGSVKSSSFNTFHWIQPKLQRSLDDIEEFLQTARIEEKQVVEVSTKEFSDSVKNAVVFYKESNFRDTPLQFMALQSKYSVSAALPDVDSIVEGTTLTPVETPLRIFFQAASIRDYLKMLDMDKSCTIEAYATRIILLQKAEGVTLCYLLPRLSK